MTRIHTITYEQAKKWYDSGRKRKPIGTKLTKNIWLNYDEANDRYGYGRQVLKNPTKVNDMLMAVNDEDFTTVLPVLWLAACRNTLYYWDEPKWSEIGASYDWVGAFNRLVDSVREGLRNEQGAVEYVLDRPEE